MPEDALSRRVWSTRRLRARLEADEAGGGGGNARPKKAVYNLTTSSGGGGLTWEAISDEIGLTDEPKGHTLELPGAGFCNVLAQVQDPGTIPPADADCLVQWLTTVAIEIDSTPHDASSQVAGLVEFTASGATPTPNVPTVQIAGSVEAGKVLCPSLLVRYVPLMAEGTTNAVIPDGSIIQATILFWTYNA